MNNLTKKLILGCAAISLASFVSIANAQEPRQKCKDQANPQECMQAHMAKFMAKRESAWHDELKITAAQEPAWKEFIASFPQAGVMKREHETLAKDEAEKTPAPKRLEQHLARMEKHHAAMQNHLAKLKALYAVLTPDQQTLLNKRLAQIEQKQFHHHHAGKQNQSPVKKEQVETKK